MATDQMTYLPMYRYARNQERDIAPRAWHLFTRGNRCDAGLRCPALGIVTPNGW
jgi:hypothetical protein